MQVLVTGATGFLGKKICGALLKDGHRVTAVSRNVESARERLPEVSEIFPWDPGTSTQPSEAIEKADAIVNLAGESVMGLWTASKKRSLRESRVKSTRGLVDAMGGSSSRPKVLLSASAVGYYGNRGEEELFEGARPGAGFLSDLCAAWEQEALRASGLGVRVATLRIGLVLGREGGMWPPLIKAARLGLSGSLGSGKQWWPWVHVDDVVGITRFALANDVEGPVNVTSPNPVRQREFARTLGRVTGRPSFLWTPSFLLALAGGVAAGSLESTRALPMVAARGGYNHLYPDLATALTQLVEGC
jgi:uncharacterized protein (TIGR01777 family)